MIDLVLGELRQLVPRHRESAPDEKVGIIRRLDALETQQDVLLVPAQRGDAHPLECVAIRAERHLLLRVQGRGVGVVRKEADLAADAMTADEPPELDHLRAATSEQRAIGIVKLVDHGRADCAQRRVGKQTC